MATFSFVGSLGKRAGAALLAVGLVIAQPAHAQTTCPFDDGNSTLAAEGVVLTRYALGITGAPLVAGTGINAVDAPTVQAAINCPSCGLNITGNATMTVADATIISRKLAGFSGAALTDGVALGSGTRNNATAVQSFLLAGCGATGGTVTSVTAGTGLAGGPIITTGALSLANGYQLPQSCGNGQVPKYNTATSLWECQNDNTGSSGGSGTVTSVTAGTGLAGGPITTTGALSLATGYQLPQSCANGQVASSNGAGGWLCTGPPATVANAFVQGGNAFGAPGVMGTTDAQPLTVRSGGGEVSVVNSTADGLRVSRVSNSVNVVNGASANAVAATFTGSTIAGGGIAGFANTITGDYATISGGNTNTASAGAAVVSGGSQNIASGSRSTISGGERNRAGGGGGVVGGGSRNGALGTSSVVSGGDTNVANEIYSTVSGGNFNAAFGVGSTVGGGGGNVASGKGSTVSGGGRDEFSCGQTFDGSCGNRAVGDYSVISGGEGNHTGSSGDYGSIGGGASNRARGLASTVAGGWFNTADGIVSTVAGGFSNTASGELSFAAGHRATASQSGQFTWADNVNVDFNPETLGGWGAPGMQANTFNVRATGGFWLVSGINASGVPNSGCILGPSGTGWACSSDRAVKEGIRAIKPRQVLDRLLAMPVSTWAMIGTGVQQMGPMSQDFFKAFNLGRSDKMINSVDAQGVAFAAIQGLNQKLTEQIKAKDHEIAKLKAKYDADIAAIKRKLGM